MSAHDQHMESLANLRDSFYKLSDSAIGVLIRSKHQVFRMNGLDPARDLTQMQKALEDLANVWHLLDDCAELYRKRVEMFEAQPRHSAAPESKPVHRKLDRRSARYKKRCHGTARDGGPCLGPALKGTSFCYHHQDQAVTITAMSDLVVELAGSLEPGGST